MVVSLDRTRRVFLLGALALAALSAGLLLAAGRSRALAWVENGTYDARVRWSARPERADRDIVIIDVDNASFDALKEKLGRWPWTRRVWTEFVRYVARGQPRVIAFDVIFGGRENEAVDGEFARVMRAAGNVVLPYSFSPTEMEDEDTSSRDARLRLLARHALPGTSELGERLALRENALNVPLTDLGEAAAGLGCVNAALDPDGAVRRIALQFNLDGKSYPALSVRVADLASRASPEAFQLERRWGSGYAVRRAGNLRLPVDDASRMLLRWHGGVTASYPLVPAWQLICSIYPGQCPENKEYFPPDYFRGKIVLVGASAQGSYEARATAFGEAEPGFLAHATAIDNLLRGEAIRPAPRWVPPLLVALMALAGAGILIAISSALRGVAAFLACVAAYTGLAWLAFDRWLLWLPLVAPLAALSLSYGSSSLLRYATTGRELRRTRRTLDRYISPRLVEYVLDNLESMNLAGDKRQLTILFSDVRNFTTLSEQADPMELIALLNEYLEAMTEIIFKYDGIVDKFIGDGILAYWGAFTPGSNHALLAARASLEMLERLEQLNQHWAARGRKQIAIGIGLNTGEVVFGNVGSGKKVEFTVIGDPVNLASRLEGLNKEFKTSIIISEFTRALLGDAASVRSLGGVKVKGKTVETAVFELQGLKDGAATAKWAAQAASAT